MTKFVCEDHDLPCALIGRGVHWRTIRYCKNCRQPFYRSYHQTDTEGFVKSTNGTLLASKHGTVWNWGWKEIKWYDFSLNWQLLMDQIKGSVPWKSTQD